MFEKWSHYFKETLWHTPVTHYPIHRKVSRRLLAIGIKAARGFALDDCYLRAASLTFYSLLSIVPVLAVAFGIAKGFGFEKHLQAELSQKFLEQREIADKLIDFARNTLESAESGVIAGVGLVVLFYSVLKLLGNIESALNAIWKVKKPRTLARQFSDYLAMMLFCPFFFAASSSLSVFIMTEIAHFSRENRMWETISPLIFLTFQVFPLILSWLLFSAIYYIMPNTKVSFSYALLAGIIAGTSYQVVQWIYIKFQLGLASYGAIYGSFAALPLFLIWLNTSWLIVLVGAEIAYHAENEMALSPHFLAAQRRQVQSRILGLVLMQQAVHAFRNGDPPPTAYSLAQRAGVAVGPVRHLIDQLIEHGLLVEVTWRDGTSGHFQPGRSVKNITLKAVCDALNNSRHEYYPIEYTKEVENYAKILANFDDLLNSSSINKTFEEFDDALSSVRESNNDR